MKKAAEWNENNTEDLAEGDRSKYWELETAGKRVGANPVVFSFLETEALLLLCKRPGSDVNQTFFFATEIGTFHRALYEEKFGYKLPETRHL